MPLEETRPPADALDVDVVCAGCCPDTRIVLYTKPRENGAASGPETVGGTNRWKGLALSAAEAEGDSKLVANELEADVEFRKELRGPDWNVEVPGSAELAAATQ